MLQGYSWDRFELLRITNAPLVKRDGLDQRIEFLSRANSKLLEGAACNARNECGIADRELQIDNRAGLLTDAGNVGSEHIEYTNFGGLPEGK